MGELARESSRERGARLSIDGRYRYALWRRWDYEVPSVLFVMLNPSTADAEQDDPTIRRCIGFARRWGFGGVRVCNLYAYRATDPLADRRDHARQLGGISQPQRRRDLSGRWRRRAHHRGVGMRTGQVLGILARSGQVDIEALALTKSGRPRHPLYVRGDAEPVVYRERVRHAA